MLTNLLRWVRANERLPRARGIYFIKYVNHNGEQRRGSLFDGFKFPHHKSEIEWLEEIEAPLLIIDKTDEIIEEALQKFPPLPYGFWNMDRVLYVTARIRESIMDQLNQNKCL